MADAKSLRDLFIENLCRAYDAEKRLVDALPGLRDAAHSEDLKHALQTHFEETEVHVSRLDQIFEWLGEKARTQTCKSIKGILDDGTRVRKLEAEPDVKDAALIAAAQEAEHFEIALYRTLRTWAVVLARTDAMQALEVTLEEEKAADALLTNIAATLNLRAAHAD
jgi:ferritin-like metal-binding protein YciE